jgi:hypothetical protein
VAATIDWQRPAEWYDKELSQILGQPGQRCTVDSTSVNRCDGTSEVRAAELQNDSIPVFQYSTIAVPQYFATDHEHRTAG